MSSYVNPGAVPENLAGKSAKVVFILTVPASTEIEFTAGKPNEPLYVNGVGRYRWLLESDEGFQATEWVTVHGFSAISVEPQLSTGRQKFFEFFPEPGVTFVVQDRTY